MGNIRIHEFQIVVYTIENVKTHRKEWLCKAMLELMQLLGFRKIKTEVLCFYERERHREREIKLLITINY